MYLSFLTIVIFYFSLLGRNLFRWGGESVRLGLTEVFADVWRRIVLKEAPEITFLLPSCFRVSLRFLFSLSQ
jgi:hypothetical protein